MDRYSIHQLWQKKRESNCTSFKIFIISLYSFVCRAGPLFSCHKTRYTKLTFIIISVFFLLQDMDYYRWTELNHLIFVIWVDRDWPVHDLTSLCSEADNSILFFNPLQGSASVHQSVCGGCLFILFFCRPEYFLFLTSKNQDDKNIF